jgi:biopolymer transport protein ExbD/biopolymer transport protein TolR
MAHDPRAGQDLKSDINVTPLVDVMLVLLIIFMLVTPLLQQGVGVELPQAHNVQPVSEDKSQVMMVVLKGSGEIFLDDARVDRGALEQLLKSRLTANPALQLQVKADRNLRYGDVKRIVQASQKAGFRGASLIAEEIRADAPPASR